MKRPAARWRGCRSGCRMASQTGSPCAAGARAGPPQLRLVCHEGEFDELLSNWRCTSWTWCWQARPRAQSQPAAFQRAHGTHCGAVVRASLAGQKSARDRFPQSLQELPVLLPTVHSPLRTTLDGWFHDLGLRPRVVGEFEDSALLAVFAARGLGCSPSASWARRMWGWCAGCACWATAPTFTKSARHLVAPGAAPSPGAPDGGCCARGGSPQ